jgi:hypothetical protein
MYGICFRIVVGFSADDNAPADTKKEGQLLKTLSDYSPRSWLLGNIYEHSDSAKDDSRSGLGRREGYMS